MARATNPSCSIRSSCARKDSRCRPGWNGAPACGRRSKKSDGLPCHPPPPSRTERDLIMAPAPSKPPTSRWLVSTEWLAARLRSPDLVVVDGSYYLPAHKRDAAAEYLAG